MDVIGLFSQSKLDEKARHDFYLAGMISKFIDDMLDIIRDIKEGSPNLLYALVSNCSSELATFTSAMHDHNYLSARWWRKHCPSTYQQYYQHIASYYNQVQSAGLRFACDLQMLAAVFNLNIDELRLWTSNVSRLPPHHMLYSTLTEKYNRS